MNEIDELLSGVHTPVHTGDVLDSVEFPVTEPLEQCLQGTEMPTQGNIFHTDSLDQSLLMYSQLCPPTPQQQDSDFTAAAASTTTHSPIITPCHTNFSTTSANATHLIPPPQDPNFANATPALIPPLLTPTLQPLSTVPIPVPSAACAGAVPHDHYLQQTIAPLPHPHQPTHVPSSLSQSTSPALTASSHNGVVGSKCEYDTDASAHSDASSSATAATASKSKRKNTQSPNSVSPQPVDVDDEDPDAIRKRKNRESAKQSRNKKRAYVNDMARTVDSLTEENQKLQQTNTILESQNSALQEQLMLFKKFFNLGGVAGMVPQAIGGAAPFPADFYSSCGAPVPESPTRATRTSGVLFVVVFGLAMFLDPSHRVIAPSATLAVEDVADNTTPGRVLLAAEDVTTTFAGEGLLAWGVGSTRAAYYATALVLWFVLHYLANKQKRKFAKMA